MCSALNKVFLFSPSYSFIRLADYLIVNTMHALAVNSVATLLNYLEENIRDSSTNESTAEGTVSLNHRFTSNDVYSICDTNRNIKIDRCTANTDCICLTFRA